jgi:hypothetical protein
VAVYIIIALVLVVILWAAYRAFGRPASSPPDPSALLQRAAVAALDASDQLDRAQPGAEPWAAGAVRALRRRIDGCAQLLESVDTATLDDRHLSQHALLTAAVEDLGWALRLEETAGFVTNSGLRAAAEMLRAEAHGCLSDFGEVAARSAVAKEVDGPA